MKHLSIRIQHLQRRNHLLPYLDGQLDGRDQQTFEKHLQECTVCSQAVSAAKIVRGGLHEPEAGAIADGEHIWRQIQARLNHPKKRRRFANQIGYAQLRILALMILFMIFVATFLNRVETRHNAASLETAAIFDIESLINQWTKHGSQALETVKPGGCCDLAALSKATTIAKGLKNSKVVNNINILANTHVNLPAIICAKNNKQMAIITARKELKWHTGRFDWQEVMIDGIRCQLLEQETICVLRWETNENQILVIGDLNRSDLKEILNGMNMNPDQ